MAAASKKEVETAMGKIKTAMEGLTQNYPEWIQLLDKYVEEPDSEFPEELEATRRALAKFLSDACAEIKRGAIGETEFLKLFDEKYHSAIQKLSEPYLRVFRAFAPLQAVYDESPAKAENLIDQIWQQYVIRFNPRRKIERPGDMTDDDMANLEGVLNSYAEYCVVRTLHYDAIIYRIQSEANLSDGLSAYIARKIDTDYQNLRLNYIVSQLERLEPPEDEPEE